ncbi:hypothetical protein SAFG77S_08171 [Streptomyces afghaniensis]
MSDDAPSTTASSAEPTGIPNKGKLTAKDLNEVIRYTLWVPEKLKDVLPEDRAGCADKELFDQLAGQGRDHPPHSSSVWACAPTPTS